MQLYEDKKAYLEDHHVNLTENFKGAFIQLGNEECLYPPSTIPWNSEDMITWCEEETQQATQKWELLTDTEREKGRQPNPPKQVFWKSVRIRITSIARSQKWFDGVFKEAKFNFQTLMDPTFYPKVQSEIDTLYRRETTPMSYSKPTIKVRTAADMQSGEGVLPSSAKTSIPRGIGLNIVKRPADAVSVAATPLPRKQPYRPAIRPTFAATGKTAIPFGLGLSVKRK